MQKIKRCGYFLHTRADIHTNTPGTLRTLLSCDPQGYRPAQTFTPPGAGSVFQAFPQAGRLRRAPSPKNVHNTAWPGGPRRRDQPLSGLCPITVRPRTSDLARSPGSRCARVAGRSVRPTCDLNPPEGLAGRAPRPSPRRGLVRICGAGRARARSRSDRRV